MELGVILTIVAVVLLALILIVLIAFLAKYSAYAKNVNAKIDGVNDKLDGLFIDCGDECECECECECKECADANAEDGENVETASEGEGKNEDKVNSEEKEVGSIDEDASYVDKNGYYVIHRINPEIEEKPEECVERAVIEEVGEDELQAAAAEVVIGDVEDNAFASLGSKPRIPFSNKMLGAEEQTQVFFDAINNEFNLFRKVHIRISASCASYRFGRDLIAKVTYRGTTMKMHLALPVDKYEVNKYHQKDLAEVKAYEEVPFTVKVKSGRALKRALELINELATVKGIVKKKTTVVYDTTAELKKHFKEIETAE